MKKITCPKSNVAFDWVRRNQLVVWYGLHEWPAIVLRDMATRLNFSIQYAGGRLWLSLYRRHFIDLNDIYALRFPG